MEEKRDLLPEPDERPEGEVKVMDVEIGGERETRVRISMVILLQAAFAIATVGGTIYTVRQDVGDLKMQQAEAVRMHHEILQKLTETRTTVAYLREEIMYLREQVGNGAERRFRRQNYEDRDAPGNGNHD